MIEDKVLELRQLVITKIDEIFKTKTYWKSKKFIVSYKTSPIKNCLIFDIGDFYILFGEIKNTSVGGSYINESIKPIIWVNTWTGSWLNDFNIPLLFNFQYRKFLKTSLFILDHELTHYVDDKFHQKIIPISASKKEYYNCTVEVNAYYCQIVLDSKNFKDFYYNLCNSHFINWLNFSNKKKMIKRGYLYFSKNGTR